MRRPLVQPANAASAATAAPSGGLGGSPLVFRQKRCSRTCATRHLAARKRLRRRGERMQEGPSCSARQRCFCSYGCAVRRAGRKPLGIPPETVLAHLRFAPSGGKESPAVGVGKRMQEG
ncbi:MAG: hypothetical protein J2P36_27540 [Ktedonobacteraceae bacterium]|nr:hypothetical protein [Ktedonobacteraceae bacterium]